MFKFAHFQIIEAFRPDETASIRTAHRAAFTYKARPGFILVRSRAISSRCNDNFDEFPADEIKTAYRTFVGKPVFVNHHNADHRRARGVIVDAVLHEDTNPDGSPDTWVEVLMEVDAVRFPMLAEAILTCTCGHKHSAGSCDSCGCQQFDGQISRTSMGCDVAYSKCSFCGNKAVTPLDYCDHIKRHKGRRIRRRRASGGADDVLVREICYGLRFFENSLLVEEPADPTAYFLGVDASGLTAAASIISEGMTVEIGDVATYLDKLAGIVSEAVSKESKREVFNLCEVSVPGTNLFCDGNKGHGRASMPQLSDPDGNDITDEFREHLEAIGHRVTNRTVVAAGLKATQGELIAKKVAGIYESLKAGKDTDGIRKRIFVSQDNYIVDGHHRWAALCGYDLIDGDVGDVSMDIAQVDMGIDALMREAKQFAASYGVKQRGMDDKAAAKKPCGCGQRTASKRTARGPLDISVNEYGMTYDPEAARSDWLAAAREWDGWNRVPPVAVPLDGLIATEALLSSQSINKVVSGGEAFRAGYDPHLIIDRHGRKVIVDGHHRVAMHIGRGDRTMPAKVVDLSALSLATSALQDHIYRWAFKTTAISGSIWRTRSTGTYHRTMNCSHIRGEIVEPVGVEDVSEEGVVARYGPNACTSCFPSAPAIRAKAYERKTRTPEWDEEDERLHPRNRGKFTDGAPQGAAPAAPKATDSFTPDEKPGAQPEAPGQPAGAPAPAVDTSEFVPHPNTTGVGSKEDPVRTESVEDAAAALALGLHVELSQPKQVSTLLEKLSEQIAAAKASGSKLDIDLCNVTVKGTNLFCAESKGIPRIKMPQLKVAGERFAPDSRAVKELQPNAKGEYDLQPLFLQHLKDQGYTAEETQEAAVNLKATQNQLNGGKIAGMTDALLAGKSLGDEPIFVSEDDYIVDGHHRWAANAAADYADNKGGDFKMSIWRINIDIITLLQMSNEFAAEYGAPQASVTASKRPCSDCGPSLDEMNAHAQRKMAADIYDKRRLKGDIFGFEHNGRWHLGEATKAVGGTVKTIVPFGSTEALDATGLELLPVPRHVIVDPEGLRRAYPRGGFASKDDASRYAWGFTMANGPLMEHMEETGQWTEPRPPWFRSDKEHQDHMRRTKQMVDRTEGRTSAMALVAYVYPDGRKLDATELGRIAVEEGILTAQQVGDIIGSNKHAYTDLEKVLRKHLHSMWAKGLIDIGPYHDYLGPDDTWAEAEQRAKAGGDLLVAAALTETYGIRFGADGEYRDIGSREEAYQAAREESTDEWGRVYVIGHYGNRVATFEDGRLVWERTASLTTPRAIPVPDLSKV